MSRAILLVLIGAAMSACVSPAPQPTLTSTAASDRPPASASARSSPSSEPSDDPSTPATPDDEPLGLTPGRPFRAEDILQAMRASRRPGGVPDEIETTAIARAVADEIWTIHGEPWSSIVAGASCGPRTCTLEISGAPPDAVGDDLWVFEVTPTTGTVTVTTSVLRGMRPSLLEIADAVVRGDPAAPPADAILTSSRWLPPPASDLVVLSYRNGAETGACGADYTVDIAGATVADETVIQC